jgi:Helicase C-terminal domain/Type III restriction enzyme, res subunit
MAIDFSRLGGSSSADTVTDPQKLFQALPAKAKRFRYLRDVQGEVLARWYETRGTRDRVIKMNTGGGKTPVGLLILKSCLNEGIGPAVYVAPDNYLCAQVRQEARDLGILTIAEPRSSDYQSGKAILLIPIHTLINGKSKFGVGAEGSKLEIGSIVVDDAHACLAVTENQFTLSLDSQHEVFSRLFALFRNDLRTQSSTGVAEIVRGDPRPLIRVPYWAWNDKQEAVVDILADHRDDDDVKWAWPLLKEELPLCQCLFTSSRVEIASRCLPINAVPSFARAQRRIYMTATLADDGVLVTDFDADPAAVNQPITPKTASDLGERMILVPQEINPGITDIEIKKFVAGFASEQNVVVIVPSGERAKFWADVANLTLTAENMQAGVETLRSSTGQLAVMINKYDGVDLPDDACRVLVVDGLPDARRLIDRRDQAILGSSDRYRSRQVQRIEQGMGRGIRSNDDYCVVLLMGAQLLSVLYATGAARYFSPATASQLKLSKNLADQIARQGLAAIGDAIKAVLERDPGWIAAARNALIEVTYPTQVGVDRAICRPRWA